MKELKDLLKQGESLMREIRETLDKPKGVIVKPGMLVIFRSEKNGVRVVTTWPAFRRSGRSYFRQERMPLVDPRGDGCSYCSSALDSYTTLDGQPIIGYEDDA